MKYVVFAFAALGVPPLAFLLFLNPRWTKYAFWAMCGALCFYGAFKLNFFSRDWYRGSARGMEVSVIYLLSLAVVAAHALRRRFAGFAPEWGFRLYLLYFLLCLPSVMNIGDAVWETFGDTRDATVLTGALAAWCEIWKMAMLYVFSLSVYTYAKATDDIKSVLGGLAAFSVLNFLFVVKAHFQGVYQPNGLFPHQNCMAMAMHLFTGLFFASYLVNGLRTRFDKFLAFAFVCSIGALMRSYSRGAIAMAPVTCGIVLAAGLWKGLPRRWPARMIPLALAGLLAFLAMLPRLVERFERAPETSASTRVELAALALEMIRDKPFFGVGINNWGIKCNPPYAYCVRAGREIRRDNEGVQDGVVETVYLLVGAECGLLGLGAMLLWFLYYYVSCFRLLGRLRGTRQYFIPLGLLGGLTASYLQSVLEWVLRQQMNLIILMFTFAIVSYLNTSWRRLRKKREME